MAEATVATTKPPKEPANKKDITVRRNKSKDASA